MIALPLPLALAPRLDRVRHLALYTAFHGSPGNRRAHAVFVPVILFTMMCIQAYVRVPTDHPLGALLHLATLVSLLLFAVLATVDLGGALALLAALLPACALAGWIVAHLPWPVVVSIATALHLASWFATVVIGHAWIEPPIDVGDGPEDSNVYFRRGYFRGRDLGVGIGLLDAAVQFCIAPLSVAQDALVQIGLRRGLETEIERERARVVERLARGRTPLR